MQNWTSQFMDWLKEICPWNRLEDYCQILNETENPRPQYGRIRVYVYTHDYQYYIVARKNYLGCQASCRKPRAGEEHTRGNDLPDGKFNRKTWDAIKIAIIQYELVKRVKPRPSSQEQPTPDIAN